MAYKLAGCAVLVLSGCAVGGAPFAEFNNYRAMKFANVVQQRQDFSCGAAAVATLLTFGLGKPTSEDDVLAWADSGWDLTRIAQRGFNLLQLAEYVRAQGLQVAGASIGYDRLKTLPEPVVVHMDVLGFAHFAVLRGIASDRVYLADPSFGNLSMPVQGFKRLWLVDGAGDGSESAGASGKGTILAVRSEGAVPDLLSIRDDEDIARLYDVEDFTIRLAAAREGSGLERL